MSGFATNAVLAERQLKVTKQTVAITLNAALREIAKHHHSNDGMRRMRHDLAACQEALQILLKPEPEKSPGTGKRKRRDYIDIDELTGEK